MIVDERMERQLLQPTFQSFNSVPEFVKVDYHTEPVYTIKVSSTNYARIEQLCDNEEIERQLREKHPALQKAYEQYKTIFYLLKNQEKYGIQN